MCGAGCCHGHLWKWIVGILVALGLIWFGMHIGYSKAMWRGGNDGGCGMSKYWNKEGKGGCKDGGCPMQPAVVESDTTTTGS